MRFSHWESPRRYMDSVARGERFAEIRWVKASELPFEFMLDGLRLVRGVSADAFEARTGLPRSAVARRVEAARAMGLVTTGNGRLAATGKGMDFLSDLQEMFLD